MNFFHWRYSSAVEHRNHNSYAVGSNPTFAKVVIISCLKKKLIMTQKIRPLSPHLTIYKPQLTSVLSIFHRITGVVLSLVLTLSLMSFYINVVFVGASTSYCLFFDLFSVFSTFFLAVGYFLLTSISYHMINGMRHLSWDLALGLEIKNLYTTGMIVVSLVFVIVIITIIV